MLRKGAITICIGVLAAALFMAVPPAGAQSALPASGTPLNIGMPYVAGPGFTYAEPFAFGGFLIRAVNTSTLANDFTGSFSLAFQPTGVGTGLIAAPVIAETTSDAIVATRSYFFNDIVSAAG